MAGALYAPSGSFSRRSMNKGDAEDRQAARSRRSCSARNTKRCAVVLRQQSLPARCSSKCRAEERATRVYAISDLHADYGENMAWVKGLSTEQYASAVLLVAGDVAETYSNFVATMKILKDRFRSVFFVPGNHDLWLRREGGLYRNSLEKLNALLHVCRELGVQTSPGIVDDVGIVPLYSWYHESFDKEKDVPGFRIPSVDTVCKDYHACKWPMELSPKDTSLAHYFDSMNEKNYDSIKNIKENSFQIITFSHYVPRQDLCPEKRMLFYPNLPKIIGSDLLEARLRSIHDVREGPSPCHIFGHTHFCWDAELDGIRYVQAPLAYPRERKRRMNGGADWLPFCIYDRGLTEKLSPCWWSDYYASNKRDPDNVDLEPWVAKLYRRRH